MQSFLQFSERFGHMLSRVFLTLLYFIVLGPFAIVYRVVADPLRRKRPSGSNWTTWVQKNDSLVAARRQD